ncbi:TKL protein kinase [Pelomyxa schiedti]|nr:TKL protein kinase [Pelomyxa schiedti]
MGSFTLIHSDSIQYDRLHDKLGEGAFAIAFKASWKGKHVAVKELKASPEVTESPEIVKIFLDFKREASIMQTLHHPNVVELFGIMFDPLRIVMCLVPSGSLDKLLKKSKENSDMFPPSLQNRIIVDITKGLSFLHSQEPAIIHRDLRSPNVFLECLDPDSPTVAKIADFGLSERLIPQASGLLLTWQWIAPEAMDTRISSYDEKSDVYSLGMVILETYTRAPPFDELWLDPRFCKHIPGEPEGHPGVLNTMSIKSAICSDGLRPVLPASCPEVIQQLLLGMWDRNPQNRPGASLVLKKLNAAFGIVQNEPHESFHSPLRKLTRFSRVEIDLPPHHRAWAVICAGDSIWFGTEKEQSKELGSSRNSAHLPNFPEAPKKPPPLPQSSKILPPKPSAKAPPRPPSSPATPTPHAETEVHSSSGYACIFNIAPPKALCALEIQSSRVYGLVNLGYDVWCSSEEGFIHILRRDTLLVKKKFMPHASGRMIKCLTQVTTLEGDLQIWSCSPSPSDGEIAIIDSKYNVIGAIHVDQPTNFGEQVSRDRVWIGCYALIIIIDIETRKEVERFPLTAKAKVTGILSCQPRGSIEPLVWVSCGQNIFGLGLNNKELIFAMEFETTITCMQGLLNDFILCGDANSKIYIYSINDKHHEHHHLVTTLEGFPKKPVKAIAIVLPTTTSNSSSALMAAPSQSSSDASSSSTTSHTNNDVSIWVAYGSTDKAIVFSALS